MGDWTHYPTPFLWPQLVLLVLVFEITRVFQGNGKLMFRIPLEMIPMYANIVKDYNILLISVFQNYESSEAS